MSGADQSAGRERWSTGPPYHLPARSSCLDAPTPTCMPLRTKQYKSDIVAMHKAKSYRFLARAWLVRRVPGVIKTSSAGSTNGRLNDNNIIEGTDNKVARQGCCRDGGCVGHRIG